MKKLTLHTALLVIVSAVLVLPATIAEANHLCGATIMSDLKPKHDLSCPGDGLVIGADGVEVELNGHTISGSGSGSTGVGITVGGRNGVEIEGSGTVRGFRIGVLVSDSSDVEIDEIRVAENGLPRPTTGADPNDGIRVANSRRIEVEDSTAVGNGDDGINLVSTEESRIEDNLVRDNGHNGIRLDASDRNTIEENVVDGNGDLVGFPRGCGIELFGSQNNRIEENEVIDNHTGIRLRAQATPARASTGNEVTDNEVTKSAGTDPDRGGIHLRDSSTSGNLIDENEIEENHNGIALSGGPTGNTFDDNEIEENVCGIRGSTAGNTFDDNELEDNGQDFCA